ncbi:hypothetical protein HCH_00975 [Hahella chejuensis KCTC 2396]|uniref:Uncharacterized protein n=1 Tax=Hahella chejuensis (strain KCTC 2396) TaxID=349521 RepID=Q2SNB2_HAHCH|nr:hypothetical protein HCH_00975 [Hahella chejuensis KCTC 2396]
MKPETNESLLFALTHPYEVTVMQEMREYFEWMYYAN